MPRGAWMYVRFLLCYPVIVQALRGSDSNLTSPTACLNKPLGNLYNEGYHGENPVVSLQRNCSTDHTGRAVVTWFPNQVSEVPGSAGVTEKSKKSNENSVTSGVKFMPRE